MKYQDISLQAWVLDSFLKWIIIMMKYTYVNLLIIDGRD